MLLIEAIWFSNGQSWLFKNHSKICSHLIVKILKGLLTLKNPLTIIWDPFPKFSTVLCWNLLLKTLKLDWSEVPSIDVVVVASVAVAVNGVRLGKGLGFAELEWAILVY